MLEIEPHFLINKTCHETINILALFNAPGPNADNYGGDMRVINLTEGGQFHLILWV